MAILFASEVASFITYFQPNLKLPFFIAAAAIALAAAAKNLKWGLCVVVAELIVGSQGYIFSAKTGEWEISFRLALWAIVLIIYAFKAARQRRIDFIQSPFFKAYLLLAAAIVWGIVWGLVNGNNPKDLFFDVNNYFFFLLIFPFYSAFKDKPFVNLFNIIAVALVWLAVKSLFFFYIFSHNFPLLQSSIYYWTRETLLAEITNVSVTMSRIFAQSQIWAVFGLVLGWGLLLAKFKKSVFILVSLLSAAALVSFSRSFWLALILSALISVLLGYYYIDKNINALAGYIIKIIGSAALGFIIVAAIIFAPIPSAGGKLSLISQRAAQFGGESVSTRWAILRPLASKISVHPVLGSGFGSSVTYNTSDPRALAEHPDGFFTTTAFEWGYLDMILEFGLLGLGIYFYLIFKIIKTGLLKVKTMPAGPQRHLLFGAMLGLIAIALTHGVSPYLNHPLGIGIVLLATIAAARRSSNPRLSSPTRK